MFSFISNHAGKHARRVFFAFARHILLPAAGLFLLTLCVACAASGPGENGAASAAAQKDRNTLTVLCVDFPEYDWTRSIIGAANNSQPASASQDKNAKKIVVQLLNTAGADMHSYQPSTADIAAVASCDVLVYTGGTSENWVTSALKEAVNPDMTVVNLMDYLGDSVKEEELAEGMQGDSHGHTHSHAQEDDDHDGSHDHGEEHHHEDEIEYDEHIWLSVKNAEKIVEELTNVLAGKDTKHAQAIRENASAYQSRLNELDTQYAQAVQSAKHDTVLFGDRFPFRYLVDDYGINYYAAFAGCSSETSASFKTVVFLSGKIDELGLSKVLVIENSGEQVAKTVIENTKNKNAEILTLDSMQSVTKKQIADGYTYLSVMEKNLEVLKAALN